MFQVCEGVMDLNEGPRTWPLVIRMCYILSEVYAPSNIQAEVVEILTQVRSFFVFFFK